VIVEVAFATTSRIGETLALDAENGAALGAFWNLKALLAG